MADFGKISLAALSSHKIAKFAQKGSNEKIECIVLPIKKNHLFKSEKGNVYLDIVAFKLKKPMVDEDGAIQQTHLVKQSLPKEVRAAMTDEEKMEQPIIGNLNIFDGYFQEKEAKPDDTFSTATDMVLNGDNSDDDLPF